MINNEMRLYNYYTFGDKDEYGQPALSAEPVGQARIAIFLSTQTVQVKNSEVSNNSNTEIRSTIPKTTTQEKSYSSRSQFI